MIVLSLEEFTAKRRTDQSDLETLLLPFVHDALEQRSEHNWDADLLAFIRAEYLRRYHAEGGTETPTGLRKFLSDVKATLDKTDSDSEVTAERIAVWLATAILNDATLEATSRDPAGLLLEWVTMHDSDVRETHREVEGQQRPPGEPFDVGGEKLRYPGDPRASISLWINCRCAARPAHQEAAALVADAERHDTGRCIVAIPAEGDPAHDLSMEDPAHCTLVWLGTPDENPDLDMGMVQQQTASAAADLQPFTAAVKGIDQLGDEGALVWMLDDGPVPVRDRLMQEAHVSAGHEAVRQHPSFTPHTTIGYDVPLSGDGVDALSSVKEIQFDRLCVWDGNNKQEYPLGGGMADEGMTLGPVAWHGVLAPEGKWSGDKRMFADNSLRFRDLPLPLTYQKASSDGHAGSVTVAKIERIARVDGEMRAEGTFMVTTEADEAVGLISEFGRYGVSVDADDAEFDFNEDSGQVTFTSARIASASIVAIPAFAEAFVALGAAPEGFMPKCDPEDPACQEYSEDQVAASWDGSASRFTPEQWKKSCVLHLADTLNKSDHKLPIRDPGGAINKGGVHAAAARFNQVDAPAEAKAAAKSALRGAYKQIGEPVPDILASATVHTMGRGPGWITDPVATKRIHDYWTVPGQPGYEKVGWGTPGDFNRCKVEIGQEIAEEDPETVAKYMNQICAQWHHDATGFWPGHAPAEGGSLEGDPAPALSLVAAGGYCAPSEWFQNPNFDKPTPMRITDEGRVFGHLAKWTTCHIGYKGMCVSPPRSASGYAYFLTGYVALEGGGEVATGPLTIGAGHARDGLSMRAAVAHYDNTATAVCDVTCGDDEWGIWTAGWVRPGATPEMVTAMRASAPSGDWREVAPGQMELIAGLSVNTPGFLVPRVGVRNGQQVSLVAAGVVSDPEVPEGGVVEELAEAVAAAIEGRQARREKMAALAARVKGGQ